MILNDGRPPRLLLDTCALIYLFNGELLANEAVDAIENASIFVSPISAWEIGLLDKRRGPSVPRFVPNASIWFQTVLVKPSILAAPFDAEIALASCSLPEPLHRDPADRFLIATARRLGVPIVTRDRLILAYAALDKVDAMAC